jgi:hypothetical protein
VVSIERKRSSMAPLEDGSTSKWKGPRCMSRAWWMKGAGLATAGVRSTKV